MLSVSSGVVSQGRQQAGAPASPACSTWARHHRGAPAAAACGQNKDTALGGCGRGALLGVLHLLHLGKSMQLPAKGCHCKGEQHDDMLMLIWCAAKLTCIAWCDDMLSLPPLVV